jgi:hypothetical protein
LFLFWAAPAWGGLFCCLGGGISAPGRWFVAGNDDFSDFSANFSGLSLKMTISANFQVKS